jgi:hypothetical protein
LSNINKKSGVFGGLGIALPPYLMTSSYRSLPFVLSVCLVSFVPCKAVWAQTPAPAPAPQTAAAADDDDAAFVPTEPDFALINLPTTLRLPRYKGNFRLTHRFQGNLREGSFGSQAGSLFGLDTGAAIGFEFRFAVAKHLQAAAYRTNIDRQTQFYAKYDPIAQKNAMPVSVSMLASVEGANNFRRDYSPALGAVISRKMHDIAALYATPMWVHNSSSVGDVRDTGFLGLGARFHVRPSVYVVAEVSPRMGGYAPGDPEYSFAIESRYGGHVFQLNFSNTVGTTFSQIARGAAPKSLHLGFNLARKFY